MKKNPKNRKIKNQQRIKKIITGETKNHNLKKKPQKTKKLKHPERCEIEYY